MSEQPVNQQNKPAQQQQGNFQQAKPAQQQANPQNKPLQQNQGNQGNQGNQQNKPAQQNQGNPQQQNKPTPPPALLPLDPPQVNPQPQPKPVEKPIEKVEVKPQPLVIDMDKVKLEAAIAELTTNMSEYKDVIQVLADPVKRKNLVLVGTEAFGAVQEARKDIPAAMSVVSTIKDAVREGTGTSEFQAMSTLMKVLSTLAILAPVLEAVMAVVEKTPMGAQGWYITGIAVGAQTLISGLYTLQRTFLKSKVLDTAMVVDSKPQIVDAKPLIQ
jgi:hypothetical protein